ncbi:hypothetical protein ACIQNG_05270 [Streptomyces sp. NPDC091377]|uniref:hypothetical protein n=1 Tax=unclassified Streptomyces TaxID=2593676 RepID=UPI00381B9BC3
MDRTPDTQVDDLAVAVAAIDELLHALGLDRGAIDIGKLSHETGILAERVNALLDGTDADPGDVQRNFQKRLNFLRETRLKPDGKQYTLDEIGAGAGISHGSVGYLLKGQRSPGLAALASLEGFFGVQPGFFTATERQALLRALGPIRDQLTHLALLRGKSVAGLAMGGCAPENGESRLSKELREALALARRCPDDEDPEVRILADTFKSLPHRSRERILPVVWGVLGLVRAECDAPDRD